MNSAQDSHADGGGSRALHRFAVICAIATFILIFVGGLVTSTGSALAVPDWPLAYGRLVPKLVGGVRFWERREVKDVVAYLRFCFNPRDVLSFARIVSVPPRKIGNVTVDALGGYAKDIEADLLAVLADPARVPNLPRAAVDPLRKFRLQLESLRSVMGVMRPSELIDHVIEDFLGDVGDHRQTSVRGALRQYRRQRMSCNRLASASR